MLLVRTYLGLSKIHGIGLFAEDDIPEGTLVWRFNPTVDKMITSWEIDKLPEIAKQQILSISEDRGKGFRFVSLDNARFMNHADQPNCDDPNDNSVVTNRVIHMGEELTCNYRLFHKGEDLFK